MNKNEKKALISFLSIYMGSAIFLISIMLSIYYKNEVKTLTETCDMELSNASMMVKTAIFDSYMKNKEFNPAKLDIEHIKYALYDKDKKLIYSYLDGTKYVDLKKSIYAQEEFNFYIAVIDEPSIPIKYIVLETCQSSIDKNSLKIYVLITLILSSIFIGSIGYLLSKILLKPVREKIEHMDKFIKDSAHELNTPVAVLMTSVSMLKKGKNPEKMMKYILSSTKQISQIYNDIHFSAFNELNEDVNQEFNLKDLVAESVEYFTDISVTKKIQIESSLDDCMIFMDRTKTQRIVNNMMSNAIKYSNRDSTVKVFIKDNILCVEDNGIGISKSEQKEIFKRYKRGNNIEGGFGIGLDIVKSICNEYSLSLNVKSEIDKGSSFYIDFTSILIGAKCDLKTK